MDGTNGEGELVKETNDRGDIDLDDVFGSDEDDEEAVDDDAAQAAAVNNYREFLLGEEKEIETQVVLLRKEKNSEHLYSAYHKLAKHFLHNGTYQDISPMFVDGTPFLIDGFSLVTVVLQDENYCTVNGGQTLHFIYLCERIIDLICRKGGSCEIVFFKDKCSVLDDVPHLKLLLYVLKIHLKKNTHIPVHEMDSMFNSQFVEYIEEIHPCFVIMDFSFTNTFKDRLTTSTATLAERLFYYQALFVVSLGLYCIDLSYISLNNNQLYSFVCISNMKSHLRHITKGLKQFSSHFVEKISSSQPTTELLDSVQCSNNVKEFVALQVATMLNNEQSSYCISRDELVKVYLLYYSISEHLPLKSRSFPSTQLDKSVIGLQSITDKIVSFTSKVLQNIDVVYNYDCSSIADLWQGNLFETVFLHVVTTDDIKLGNKVQVLYEDMLKKCCHEIPDKNVIISNPAIETLKKAIDENGIDNLFLCKQDSLNSLATVINGEEEEDRENEFALTFSDLINRFCSEIVNKYRSCSFPKYFKAIFASNLTYNERHHWHTLRPLTDEFDRIKDNEKELAQYPMKKQMRLKARYLYYMTLYGSNLEGKVSDTKPIIVCEGKKDQDSKKKQKKLGKISSKAEEIRKQNMMKKQKEVLDGDKEKLDSFLKQYKINKTGRLGEIKNLNLINQVLLLVSTDEYTGRCLFYKAEILFLLWLDLYKTWLANPNIEADLTYLKELFLTIRQVLHCTKKVQALLTDSQIKKVSKMLYSIGFSAIAEKWKLPVISDSSYKSCVVPVSRSYIRFQLTELGFDLERRIEGKPDERVTGFVPDPWQRDMFDIVDKGESALIVAPTSSGKTYASYYCMKKILKESNDGRIVYVAPTKALVNQVAATIYTRFRSKTMPAGMSVFGVFTREYKLQTASCQILVTVPECLEILLMSPRHYKWVKSLRYVIFDEVHCLAGQAGGITWERCLMLIQCPFLALSATIENSREFWSWMSNMESFKRSLNPKLGPKVHLIVQSDRYNDIVRHVYGNDGKLHHIHPYAFLKKYIMEVHRGIPPHISMAPREIVELYNSMILSSPDDPDLKDLDPDKYFGNSDTGFVYRQDVKKYEVELKRILNNWFTQNNALFSNTIRLLYEPLVEHEMETKPYSYFSKQIVPLVNTLNSKNMLPSLVFSYNRKNCELVGFDLAEHFRNLESDYISQKKSKPMRKIVYDNVDFTDEHSKGKKITKTSTFDKTGKPERRKRDVTNLFPLELSKCITEFTLRGKYKIDNKDLQYIEWKLSTKFKKSSVEIDHLRRGVGVHHGGIVTVLRQSVEMLYRCKFLNVVFATGTLALGIHMPCKTVVILGDSPYLNTLEYHQMSGRSGRRGFDKTGDVVFFGVDTNKIRILMTSKLPKMIGNFPLTVSTVLRLLLLVNDVTDNTKNTEESYEATLNRALTVLNQGLLYQSEKNLRDQMKHFVLFSVQLLMVQGLLDNSCRPTLMAGLATHIHYLEPGNLAFIYLLRSGVISMMCKDSDNGKVDVDSCDNLMKLLCRLFTKLPLSSKLSKKNARNSIVELPPLPDILNEVLEKYNNDVKTVYKHYFKGFSEHMTEVFGDDIELPKSGKVFKGLVSDEELSVEDNEVPTLEKVIAGRSHQNLICSAFAGLSGRTDDDLYDQNSLISNIRHQVFTDCKVIPLVNLDTQLNSYAYDFYKHGIMKSIIEDNGLKSGQDYTLLLDFLLLLRSITTSLSEVAMSDADHKIVASNVYETFSYITDIFSTHFNCAYFIRST